MAEGGNYQKNVYNINIHTSQDGDTRIENKTETQIIDSSIEQLNIQQESNNDAADDPNNDAVEDPNNDAADDPNNDAVEDPNNDAAEDPNNDAVEDPNNDAADDPNNDTVEDPNNDAAEDPNNDATEDPIVQAETIQNVENMNLSSSVPIESRSRVSSDSGKTVSTKTKNNESRDGKRNSLRCELLRGQAATFCRKSKFREAESVLEEITQIQQSDVGVSVLLLISAVSIELGRKQEAKKAIDDIVRLSMTSPSDVDDVFRRASDLIVDKSYVRAIVLLRISSGIYKLHPSLSPDDIVAEIYKCVDKMSKAVKPMIKSSNRLKVIALDYGLPYMVEMVGDLRCVKNSNPISATKYEAECISLIGSFYKLAKEYEKCIEICKSGLDVMKRQLGNNTSKYKIYGQLLNVLGVANFHLGIYIVAEDYFSKAFDACNNATDFINEIDKQKCIEHEQKNLRITRNRRNMKFLF